MQCMHNLSLKPTPDMQVPRIHSTCVSTGNTESGIMIECGKERLVRDADQPRPYEEVRDARIMQHVVHCTGVTPCGGGPAVAHRSRLALRQFKAPYFMYGFYNFKFKLQVTFIVLLCKND